MKINKLFSCIEVQSHLKNLNGLQLQETAESITIYSDIFRSVPLFIAEARNGDLYLFSDFEVLFTLNDVDKTPDQIGFWEIVFFASGINDRTLYHNVKQLPAASKLIINKRNHAWRIERFWNYYVEEDATIQSAAQAADGLFEHLKKVFSKIKKSPYVMGMSGGMDSRLALAMLSLFLSPQDLQLFTYGFDERILEYGFACDVSSALGFHKPVFHKLTPESYVEATTYLPSMSGGQLGINHCHIFDFLKKLHGKNSTHLSTYYSDAVLGWDSSYPKCRQETTRNPYSTTIRSLGYLDEDVKEGIHADAEDLFKHLDWNGNFSSLSEFKYVVERNPKFHTYLAYLHGKFLPTLMPFADEELMRYSMSIPLQFKARKNLIDVILERNFPELAKIKNISSRFQWGPSFSSHAEFYKFRLMNLLNSIVRVASKGSVEFFNKHQTEEHERLLFSHFPKLLHDATEKFVRLGLMNKKQKDFFDKMPPRSAGINERYNLISLAFVLR